MLTSLRVKIGLTDTQPAEVPGSSAELPEGSPVLLIAAAGARFRGTIIAQGPLAMSVKLSPGESIPAKGVLLSLFFHNAAGIYSFPTRTVYLTKDVVQVEQSSAITFHKPRPGSTFEGKNPSPSPSNQRLPPRSLTSRSLST